jgi:hypothetical protein
MMHAIDAVPLQTRDTLVALEPTPAATQVALASPTTLIEPVAPVFTPPEAAASGLDMAMLALALVAAWMIGLGSALLVRQFQPVWQPVRLNRGASTGQPRRAAGQRPA